MFIVGYLIAIACLVLFIPWLYFNVIIACIQDIRKPSHIQSPSPQNTLESNSTIEEEEEEELEDEDIEFYNYMSGDVYYEDIP